MSCIDPLCPDDFCSGSASQRWAILDDRGRPPAVMSGCCTAAALAKWLRQRQGASGARRVSRLPRASETTPRLIVYSWTERRDDGLSCVREVSRAAVVCPAEGLTPGSAPSGAEVSA